MNETLLNIKNRYSCRNFNDKIPTDEQLNAITNAAIQAPSGMNEQPWQIILVKNKELILEIEKESTNVLRNTRKDLYDKVMERTKNIFYNAPCMIVFAIKPGYPKNSELIDLGISAQNAVLAATSLSLATLHCGFANLAFAGDKKNHLKEKLKFKKDYDCGLAVLIGHTNTDGHPHEPDTSKITIIE